MRTELHFVRLSVGIRGFRDDKSGAIAMLFALVLVPVLLIIGLSIDYGQASQYQSSIQKTLDEATVAGASELAKSGDAQKAVAVAERRFAATAPTTYAVQAKFVAEPRMKTLTADASANVRMNFMGLAGFTQLTVDAHAVAQIKQSKPTNSHARSHASQRSHGQISDHQISELVYRVETVCGRLREIGFEVRVPQCQSVFNGTFERQLRAELAAPGGNASRLLPGGVRLVQ